MSLLETAYVVVKPSNAIYLMLIAGLLVSLWRRWTGAGIIAFGLLLWGAAAYLPLGQALMAPLEGRFERPQVPPLDGILLLGGFVKDGGDDAIGTRLGDAGERLLAAAILAHQHPEADIIVTDNSEAGRAVAVLAALGVARERILTETRATSTWENARYAKTLANPQPAGTYALVTSAFHMPRAVGTFRAAGWPEPVPVPVDRRSGPDGLWAHVPQEATSGLSTTDAAVREWVSLFAYRLAGRTAALLPSPAAKAAP